MLYIDVNTVGLGRCRFMTHNSYLQNVPSMTGSIRPEYPHSLIASFWLLLSADGMLVEEGRARRLMARVMADTAGRVPN